MIPMPRSVVYPVLMGPSPYVIVIAPTQNQVVLGKVQDLVVCIMLSRAKIYHVAQKFRALENDWLAG